MNQDTEATVCAHKIANVLDIPLSDVAMVCSIRSVVWEAINRLEHCLAESKATNEFNFAILKQAHEKLQMTSEQSYSLIPDEIEEWVLSHNRHKQIIQELRKQSANGGGAPHPISTPPAESAPSA